MTAVEATSSAGNESDKVTFGPSAANEGILDLLVRNGHFKTALGAFQAAAMLALSKNLDAISAPASAGTKWNRGSIEPQIRDFLEWYIPTNQPTRLLEQLGNVGIAYIAEKVKTGGYSLTELFDLPELDIE